MKSLSDMTLDDLTAFIDARVKHLLGEFDFDAPEDDASIDTRTQEEVFASITRNRWTPPPGAKSSLELLREDRDR